MPTVGIALRVVLQTRSNMVMAMALTTLVMLKVFINSSWPWGQSWKYWEHWCFFCSRNRKSTKKYMGYKLVNFSEKTAISSEKQERLFNFNSQVSVTQKSRIKVQRYMFYCLIAYTLSRDLSFWGHRSDSLNIEAVTLDFEVPSYSYLIFSWSPNKYK